MTILHFLSFPTVLSCIFQRQHRGNKSLDFDTGAAGLYLAVESLFGANDMSVHINLFVCSPFPEVG